ncbi:hypothetical protein H8B02_17635 [Bradyrhizobium sp. Pear77]|uniref:hypothetical protein n=1 Tax=Bradyrhizobium altum TaxID=1571202 RepID=UPI001E2F8B96|nr:hypothetical protein [Bradyrhizobium altum]MCC8955191.1 hypothetical protein [Bradyrhizobium altum]
MPKDRLDHPLHMPPVDIHAAGHQPYWSGGGVGESRSTPIGTSRPQILSWSFSASRLMLSLLRFSRSGCPVANP